MTMFITVTVHTETAAIGGGRARKSRLAWSCAASASCARWCVCVHHCCEHDNDDDDVCFRLVNFRGRRRRLVASWRQWDAPMRRDRLQSTALVRASNQPDVAPTRETRGRRSRAKSSRRTRRLSRDNRAFPHVVLRRDRSGAAARSHAARAAARIARRHARACRIDTPMRLRARRATLFVMRRIRIFFWN